MKTEPEVFSFDDLLNAPQRTAPWGGVRNYQARNFMRDQFRIGDGVLFYHSRVEPPAIVGLARVASLARPDLTALDPRSPYSDELSIKRGQSQWVLCDVQATHRLLRPVSIDLIRDTAELTDMLVIKKGMRLSVQPVSASHWKVILGLGEAQEI
jgi:predicted RNA-binding protein with PUA-like domain